MEGSSSSLRGPRIDESGSKTPPKQTSVTANVNVLDTDQVIDHHIITPEGLEKNAFSPLTAFGLAFSVINSWVVLVVGLGSGLISGGPSALVWGFLYAWRNSISWITGMLNVIGLWLGAATAGYLSMILLMAAITVNKPDLALSVGQQYGIFAAILIFGPGVTLCLGVRGNRWLDQGLMVISVLCALAIVIALPATAPTRASASFVFGGLNNTTGWNSIVIAWLLGLLQSAFAYLGFDLIYHISEEMPNPRKDGPKATMWTIIISALSGMAVLLAMLFCITDITSVVSTPYILPFAQICMDTTGSRGATTIFLLIPSILFINSVRGITLTASRVLMALGRDNVLPYPKVWSITIRGEPVYGLAISVVVPLVCGLVQLGSTSTFNSLTGAATIVFEISYAIPAILMLCGGRKKLNSVAPYRTSNLGRWGVPCNLLAVFFVLQSCVIYCFPASMPVDAANMSYVVVFVGGFAIVLAVLWFTLARQRYEAPSEQSVLSIIDKGNPLNEPISQVSMEF
ncbi:uncharacterized protein I303_104947 [Kwoniella dejecticola CBS 10117]|uniref:Choline transporter n=1 Tax=Kwoniella dejecticola CBS 10117 TaxID=1296121 RepID=A0A1A6A3W2_9TREE|nr:uncharacterized protein I303_05607 [Kwoniella dejecticola CBS 10117]OBR84748.1 hypothetical protein I303_05607 [Kwoniella dejecticola CBS 10117]